MPAARIAAAIFAVSLSANFARYSGDRVPGAATLDLVLSVVAAAGCLAVGTIWMASKDTDGFLLVLFGVLNASAARSAWGRWQAGRLSPRPPSQPDADHP